MAEHRAPAPRLALGAAVVVALAVIIGAGLSMAPSAAPAFHGTTYTEIAPAAPFSLVDHEGQPVSLDTYRGKPVLLFFGFTQCPDVCPTTLATLSKAVRDAGDAANDVRILLVTVDPENDTPAALKAYAARFGPAVVGLTGHADALSQARQGYGAYVEMPAPPPPAHAHGHDHGMDHGDHAAPSAPVPPSTEGAHGDHGAHDHHAAPPPPTPAAAPAPGRVVHSGVVYGIDRNGNLQVVISDTATPEQVRDDVRLLAGI